MEYNLFVDMYKSEGFAIYSRLIDEEIKKTYQKIMSDGIVSEQLVMHVNRIKGLQASKDVCFNSIKENEGKYDDKRN